MGDAKKPETPAEKSMRLAAEAQKFRREKQAERGPVDPMFAHLKLGSKPAAEEPKKDGGRRRRNTKRSRKSRKTRKSAGSRRR